MDRFSFSVIKGGLKLGGLKTWRAYNQKFYGLFTNLFHTRRNIALTSAGVIHIYITTDNVVKFNLIIVTYRLFRRLTMHPRLKARI